MGQIKDTEKYPYDLSISAEDYLIGSDSENNGQTRNYTLAALANFFSQYINSQSDSTYIHVQNDPSTTWIVFHNMQKYPTPLVMNDLGEVVLTDISYPSLDVMHVNFGRPTTGSVTLN